MNKPLQAIGNEITNLTDHAREFMSATADVAGDKIDTARHRLASALDNGKELAESIYDNARQGTRAAENAAKAHPYQTVCIALGICALVTFALGRWFSSNRG